MTISHQSLWIVRLIAHSTLVILLAVTLALTACSNLFLAPIPTSTPAAIETSTPTILWFPVTNTPTNLPTFTTFPTVDLFPGVGDLLFADAFDQPALWSTTTSSAASAIVTRNRLLLSINGQGPLRILSLRREPVMSDFYAEVIASVGLCGSKDQVGLAFRASPGENYYRFAINCNGQMRLERVRSGQALALSDWLPSGDVPTGAPAVLKIGVWVVGSEMRFFLNDHPQFTFSDPVFHTGTLGFFAYASGSTPVVVSFSDLAVYSLFYLSPAPSITPSRTPSPTRAP